MTKITYMYICVPWLQRISTWSTLIYGRITSSILNDFVYTQTIFKFLDKEYEYVLDPFYG